MRADLRSKRPKLACRSCVILSVHSFQFLKRALNFYVTELWSGLDHTYKKLFKRPSGVFGTYTSKISDSFSHLFTLYLAFASAETQSLNIAIPHVQELLTFRFGQLQMELPKCFNRAIRSQLSFILCMTFRCFITDSVEKKQTIQPYQHFQAHQDLSS